MTFEVWWECEHGDGEQNVALGRICEFLHLVQYPKLLSSDLWRVLVVGC